MRLIEFLEGIDSQDLVEVRDNSRAFIAKEKACYYISIFDYNNKKLAKNHINSIENAEIINVSESLDNIGRYITEVKLDYRLGVGEIF